MATFTKSGIGGMGTLPSVYPRSGKGISAFKGSGTKVVTSGAGTTYVKTGKGVSAFSGYGTRFVQHVGGPTYGPPMPGPATIKPAIAFPIVPGFSLPAVPAPDTFVSAAVFQMTVTEYTPPNSKSGVNIITTIPIVNSDTMYGGISLSDAAQQLRKVTITGYFDTPTVQSGNWRVPDVVDGSGNRYTYAEYMILCNEGRVTQPWKRVHPLWFRDPHGRVYTSPKVLDFSANYTEGVPGRTNFQLTLVV